MFEDSRLFKWTALRNLCCCRGVRVRQTVTSGVVEGPALAKARKQDQELCVRGRQGGRTRTGQHRGGSNPKKQVIGKIKHFKRKTKWGDKVSLESLMWALGSKEKKKEAFVCK